MSGQPKKVLVVEDEADIRELMRLTLAADGLDVRVAGDAAVALEVLEQEGVDAVLVDLGLPRVDGFELMARIRRISAVPVILVTGWAGGGSPTTGTGADDYVMKPFRPADLRARVRAVLERSRQAPG